MKIDNKVERVWEPLNMRKQRQGRENRKYVGNRKESNNHAHKEIWDPLKKKKTGFRSWGGGSRYAIEKDTKYKTGWKFEEEMEEDENNKGRVSCKPWYRYSFNTPMLVTLKFIWKNGVCGQFLVNITEMRLYVYVKFTYLYLINLLFYLYFPPLSHPTFVCVFP